MDWSVMIDTAGDEVTAEQADDVLEQLQDLAAVLTTGQADTTLGATVAVHGRSYLDALDYAEHRLHKAFAAAGLAEREVVEVRAVEWTRFEAELEQSSHLEFVGVSELADLLGVTRQRAHAIAGGATFPEPVARLAAGPVWARPSIAHFVEGWDRKPGRPRKVTAQKAAPVKSTAQKSTARSALGTRIPSRTSGGLIAGAGRPSGDRKPTP